MKPNAPLKTPTSEPPPAAHYSPPHPAPTDSFGQIQVHLSVTADAKCCVDVISGNDSFE